MSESTHVADKTTKKCKPRKVGHIKMLVINDLNSETITPLVKENICNESTIDSDGSTSYVKLKDNVAEHRPQVIPKVEVRKVLSWVHIAISNAKRQLLNIYHHVDPQYLQSYLNEFEVVDNNGFDTVEEGVEAAVRAKADIIVLCSSDDEYSVTCAASSSSANDKRILVLAGSKPIVEELKVAGIDNFIYSGQNMVEALEKYQNILRIE